MTTLSPETLTCGALAAAMVRFDATHPATPRSESPEYRALIAAVSAKLGTAHAEREIAAAIDDALIDGAATPDAPFLPVLARHRVIADRWRE